MFNRVSTRLSVRLLVVSLLIAAITTVSATAGWTEYINPFAYFSTANESTVVVPAFEGTTARVLSAGTCDLGNNPLLPMEVESSGGTLAGTPTGYATLRAAFIAINGGTLHTGVITIDVCENSDEGVNTASIAGGNDAGTADYSSITISPAGGAARTITGATTAANSTILFSGADNITIDGLNSGGNSLTIQNTTASSTPNTSTIRFVDGASNNTITNTTIRGSFSGGTAVAGGTIFFSTDGATAAGNDGNIISNNQIGPAGSSLPSTAVYGAGTTTTTALNNSGIQITGNNIFDFFAAASADSGVFVSSGNTDWTISGNSLYQTATRTMTSAATDTGIQINNTSGNNFVVVNNFIGGSTSSAGGTPWTIAGSIANRFRGISLNVGSTTASSVQNNTVANISFTSTSGSNTVGGPWTGIYLGSGNANIGTVTGNTIGATSGTGSINIIIVSNSGSISSGIFSDASPTTSTIANNRIGAISFGASTISQGFQGIATTSASSGSMSISGNVIGSTTTTNSININTGATSSTNQIFRGINNTISTVGVSITNNTVANINNNYLPSSVTSTGTILVGISSSAGISTVTGNTVRNMSTAANHSGTTSSAPVIGISISNSTAGHTISQNTIHSLSETHATAATNVYGIYYAGSTSGTNAVERNLVHSLSVTSTGAAILRGIYCFNGSATYRNNMIRLGVDATGTSITSAALSIEGMRFDAVSTSVNIVTHNSVFIGGSGVSSGSASSAAYIRLTTETTSDLRNNIFVNNRSNSTGTGKHYLLNLNSTSAVTSDFNVFHQTGTGAVFGTVAAVDSAGFANWKTNTSKDLNSHYSDPQFIAPLGNSSVVDLHINSAMPTVVEGNGTPISPPTDDFDGQTRSGLTPVDIGADAGNFTSAGDSSAPSISYTALANTTSLTSRTLTTTITDATGVPTAGAGLPVLYWKIGAGAYTAATATYISGSTYEFTFGTGVVANDVVSYYIVAQDTAGIPNVGSSPAGASGFSINPPAAATPPASPSTYTILPIINTFPYSQDFETNNGGWTAGTTIGSTSDWQYGTFAKTQLSAPHSGTKAWVTKLTGTYTLDATSTLTSPVIDMSSITGRPTFSFWHNFKTETAWDNGILEYSINGGTVWTKVDATLGTGGTFNTTDSTFWYNNNSTNGNATGTTPPKWSATSTGYTGHSSGWIQSTTLLPLAVIGQADVRLRYRFGSDNSTTDEGWAVDDITILPPAVGNLQLSSATYAGNENAVVPVVVNRVGGSLGAVDVTLTLADVSAVGGAACGVGVDYVNGGPYLISFADGETSKTQNVSLCQDAVVDAAETFTATLSAPTNGAGLGTPISATVTIGDLPPGNLQLSSATFSGNEGSTLNANVNRVSGSSGTVGVTYTLTDSGGTPATGGAACGAGIDYVNNGGTLTFVNGDVLETISVPLCSDAVVDAAETFTITLSSPTGGAGLGTPTSATVTITDVPPPSHQFNAATYIDDESQNAVITVTRTGDTSGSSTVDYATVAGGTASAGTCDGLNDYVASNGTLGFAATETSKTFVVQLCADMFTDTDETVNLALSNAIGGTIGTQATAVLTINDTASLYRDTTVNTVPGTGTGSGTEPGSPALLNPATINVSGFSGNIGSMRVTLYDVSHTYPDDMDVLLVGPGGQTFILMADAGGGTDIVNRTITFSDSGSSVIPDDTVIATGVYEPGNWVTPVTNFPAPAPAGPYGEPGNTFQLGVTSMLSVFGGTDPNGTWSLYVRDDASGDTGSIGGWGLEFFAPTSSAASVSGRVVTANGQGIRGAAIVITGNSLPTPIIVKTGSLGYFQADNLDTGQTYVVTVVSKRFTFSQPSRVINLADNINDVDFMANPLE